MTSLIIVALVVALFLAWYVGFCLGAHGAQAVERGYKEAAEDACTYAENELRKARDACTYAENELRKEREEHSEIAHLARAWRTAYVNLKDGKLTDESIFAAQAR